MITSDIFNSLKEGDILYAYTFNLYQNHKVNKIKVLTVGQYCIGTTRGYYYNTIDIDRLYQNKKDCYVDYLKQLQKIKSDIANKKLEKFNRFIKDNVEYFI